MPGQLTRAVREERAARLIFLGEQIREQYERRLIGQECCILTEECVRTQDGLFLAGYTPEYVRILLPVQEGQDMLNRIVPVVPKDFRNGVLVAE